MRPPAFHIRTLMMIVAVAAVVFLCLRSGLAVILVISASVPAMVAVWAVRSRDRQRVQPRPAALVLLIAVMILWGIACVEPGAWGRGGFLESGEELPGWMFVLGLPPFFCCFGWSSASALAVSAKWLWEGRSLRSFLLACVGVIPGVVLLNQEEPGRFELHSGSYFWIAGLILWMAGTGSLGVIDLIRRAMPGTVADLSLEDDRSAAQDH